ncbi:hypothetical protein pb186bvf_017490 [Paramecium bursaria]
MTNTGENPTESLYWLSKRKQCGSTSNYIIIQLQFCTQNTIQEYQNNKIIKLESLNLMIIGIYKTKRMNNRTIHFVVNGDSNCFVKISLKNTIEITSSIALGGDPYNYFILSVRKISKRRNMQTEAAYYDVEWGIVDPAPIGSQEAQESKTRLTSIQDKITEMKSSTSSPYQVMSSQVNITTIDSLNFESSEKATPLPQSNSNIFIPNNTQTQSNDYVIIDIPKNTSTQNTTQNMTEINTNKTQMISQRNENDDKQQIWIIIVSVMVPIFTIAIIILGIKIFLKYRKIRRYQVTPQIPVEANYKV